MSTEENKALILRLYEEVWNQHNPEAADDFVAADVFTRGMLPEYQHGVDGYKHLVRWLHTAMPDLRMTIEDIIAEGDKVAAFVTFSGTHTGPLRDLDPSGRQVSVEQTHWYRLANGKVAETWSVRDDLGMMQQLGAIPQLGGAMHRGRITPEEISGEGSSESGLTGGITPEEISGGRHPDGAPHEVGVPPEDISGRTPPSSAPHAPRERGIPPEDISGD